MDTKQVAEEFTALCKAGQLDEAGARFWAADVVSLEPGDGPMSRCEGVDQVVAKGQWWVDNHEVHGVTVDGPWVTGDQFAVRFGMDITPRDDARMTMQEIALYTVRDGKIVEERFFY